MELTLIRNVDPDHESIPYYLLAALDGEVVPPQTALRIPVHWQHPVRTESIVKQVYSVEICGFRVEAGNPLQVLRLTGRLLPALINIARLPTYAFIARHTRRVYPVYTIGDEVFATTPGGPVFRHVELARVRLYLSDYLHTMQELGEMGSEETLHVRGVDPVTLELMRPVFYLKKRVPGEEEFWAPVFASSDGRRIYTYAASARRQAEVAGGREVVALHEIVADALIADHRLRDRYDLRPDRLFAGQWRQLEANLQRQPFELRCRGNGGNGYRQDGDAQGGCHQPLPFYRAGEAFVAVDHRPEEDRHGLFLGRDLQDVCERVAQDYVRRGMIATPEDLHVTQIRRSSPAAQPASQLDRLLAAPVLA